VEGSNPSEDLIEDFPLVVPSEVLCDFIEVFPLNGAASRIEPLECQLIPSLKARVFPGRLGGRALRSIIARIASMIAE
jgi:hypothetical protein